MNKPIEVPDFYKELMVFSLLNLYHFHEGHVGSLSQNFKCLEITGRMGKLGRRSESGFVLEILTPEFSESHLETFQHQSMNMKVFQRLECLPPLRAHTEYQWQVWGPNSDKAEKFRDEKRWFTGNTEAAKQQKQGWGDSSEIKEPED